MVKCDLSPDFLERGTGASSHLMCCLAGEGESHKLSIRITGRRGKWQESPQIFATLSTGRGKSRVVKDTNLQKTGMATAGVA